MLIAALTTGFVVAGGGESRRLAGRSSEQVATVAEKGIPVVPVSDVEQAARRAGRAGGQAQALADDYGDAQLAGLKRAIGAVGVFALLSLGLHGGCRGAARPSQPDSAAS